MLGRTLSVGCRTIECDVVTRSSQLSYMRRYSSRLAERVGGLLPFAGLFHLGFGTWMLSNQDIVPPVCPCVPLFVVCVFIVVSLVLHWVSLHFR